MTDDEPKVGDRVRYRDVNLVNYRGTLRKVEGQFASVRWDAHPHFDTKEWLPNIARAAS
jgi:hypothetical protein